MRAAGPSPGATASASHRGIAPRPDVDGENAKRLRFDYQFVDPPPVSVADAPRAPDDRPMLLRVHAFEYAFAQFKVEARLTASDHLWTNGQIERMNRTIKDVTLHRRDHDTRTSATRIVRCSCTRTITRRD
jgi:hypothetical protein